MKEAPAFLLTGAELGLVRRAGNVIDNSLSKFGLEDQLNELSEAQLAEIDTNMRAARLAPPTCCAKFTAILNRRHFCLMQTWDTEKSCFVWHIWRSDSKALGELAIMDEIPPGSPADFVLQSIPYEKAVSPEDAQAVRDYLDLLEYSYLQLDLRNTLWRCFYICEAITQQTGKGKKKLSPTSRSHFSNLDYMLFPSRKGYTSALLPIENEIAYIATFDDSFIDQLDFRDGQVTGAGAVPITVKDLKKEKDGIPQEDYDFPLMAAIYKYRWEALSQRTVTTPTEIGTAFTISRKSLAEFMHTDYETVKTDADGMPMAESSEESHRENIVASLKKLENKIGVTNNKSFYRFLTLQGYDSRKDEFILTAPYLDVVVMALLPPARSSNRQKADFLPANNFLIHSTANATRNRCALEIVKYVSSGLLQRSEEVFTAEEKKKLNQAKKSGVNGQAMSQLKKAILSDPAHEQPTATFNPSFKTVIENCPLLKARIAKAQTGDNSRQLINTALKSAFSGAFKMLKKETDCYKYFVGLNVPEVCPTSSTLSSVWEITFFKTDPDFRKKP